MRRVSSRFCLALILREQKNSVNYQKSFRSTFLYKESLTSLFIRMFTTGFMLSGNDSVDHRYQLILILGVFWLGFEVNNGRTAVAENDNYEV